MPVPVECRGRWQAGKLTNLPPQRAELSIEIVYEVPQIARNARPCMCDRSLENLLAFRVVDQWLAPRVSLARSGHASAAHGHPTLGAVPMPSMKTAPAYGRAISLGDLCTAGRNKPCRGADGGCSRYAGAYQEFAGGAGAAGWWRDAVVELGRSVPQPQLAESRQLANDALCQQRPYWPRDAQHLLVAGVYVIVSAPGVIPVAGG